MHWHAYRWTGNGADRGNEGERRPSSPDFPGSHLPPMRTGDWLAKPASRIADTFHGAEDAVGWLAGEYGKVGAALLCGDRIPLEDRLADARDLLPRGVDVQWGEWMQGGRFVTLGVICCPNRHVPHPCPLR
ncbi:hypothetical protein [Nonomuraea wenchangensis]|uniref:Uncharacterized protein n=1 Tax=Nonomuraea wenchangensis TaxID=568860 RepID=A0A1I0ER85_9ACTN|nr:hypothetical protein [Nonomuraea wenchangensis]SET47576.1 hypothetical protein SAMN05421811_103156 [Nonomuraea wenchangensis]